MLFAVEMNDELIIKIIKCILDWVGARIFKKQWRSVISREKDKSASFKN